MPAKEVIKIKTATGHVHIERTDKKATINMERTCFGYKEKSTIEVTKTDDSCIHYAFSPELSLKETFQNQ